MRVPTNLPEFRVQGDGGAFWSVPGFVNVF